MVDTRDDARLVQHCEEIPEGSFYWIRTMRCKSRNHDVPVERIRWDMYPVDGSWHIAICYDCYIQWHDMSNTERKTMKPEAETYRFQVDHGVVTEVIQGGFNLWSVWCMYEDMNDRSKAVFISEEVGKVAAINAANRHSRECDHRKQDEMTTKENDMELTHEQQRQCDAAREAAEHLRKARLLCEAVGIDYLSNGLLATDHNIHNGVDQFVWDHEDYTSLEIMAHTLASWKYQFPMSEQPGMSHNDPNKENNMDLNKENNMKDYEQLWHDAVDHKMNIVHGLMQSQLEMVLRTAREIDSVDLIEDLEALLNKHYR